jgi:hypothetical protein
MKEARSTRPAELPDTFLKFATRFPTSRNLAESIRWLYRQPASTNVKLIADSLDAVIMKCLELNPLHRYADLSELSAALVELASGREGESAMS